MTFLSQFSNPKSKKSWIMAMWKSWNCDSEMYWILLYFYIWLEVHHRRNNCFSTNISSLWIWNSYKIICFVPKSYKSPIFMLLSSYFSYKLFWKMAVMYAFGHYCTCADIYNECNYARPRSALGGLCKTTIDGMYVAIKIKKAYFIYVGINKVISTKYFMVQKIQDIYAGIDEAEIVRMSAAKRVRFPIIQTQWVGK